jgi:chemotaxis response regulator CheB
MGRDGANGVGAVLAAGGVAITEQSEHAQLPGMPEAAADAGATQLELAEIGGALALLSANGRR